MNALVSRFVQVPRRCAPLQPLRHSGAAVGQRQAVRRIPVRVGDPFRVTVGIRAPSGATIEFPRATDSTPACNRSTGNRAHERRHDGGRAVRRLSRGGVGHRLAADRLVDVIVRLNGAERRISLAGHTVFVKSVLPPNGPRVPKPQRACSSERVPWWVWVLLAAAITLA